MAERDLINAFDDCIERLSDGETIDACLRAYPQYAAELRPMLLAGQVVQRARIAPQEVQAAQARGRERLRFAMQEMPARPQRSNTIPFVRLLTQAAAVILILGLFAGGTALAAESSLPGDPLYGYKRFTEGVRLALPGDRDLLAEQFGQRRVDEIRQLLAIDRAESVDFSGAVESIAAAQWQVAGLSLNVPEGTPDSAEIRVNDFVAVQAFTTTDGALTAEQITLMERGEEPPVPTATHVPTLPPTTTVMPTATATPTASPSPSPTGTQTPTLNPTATVTPMPSQTPAATDEVSGASPVCIPTPLPNWVVYSIRSGDTLSALAGQTGITPEQLMAVNCLTDARLIVAGQEIWLPFVPSPAPSISDDDSGNDNGGSDHSGSSDDGEDDHSGSDNSGSGSSDDDDGGSSGSGSGGDDADD